MAVHVSGSDVSQLRRRRLRRQSEQTVRFVPQHIPCQEVLHAPVCLLSVCLTLPEELLQAPGMDEGHRNASI
jgi:hypothetical protein